MNGAAARSLQFRLSLWLSLIILLIALVAGALSFAQAFREAIEAQDDQLGQIAALMARQRLAPATEPTVADAHDVDADADADAHIVAQLVPSRGSGVPGSACAFAR